MSEEVSAAVAKILTAYSVALNRGSAHGVVLEDKVTLWREEEIVDPDNGETLGNARVLNIRMRVTELQEKFCIASVPRETNALFANLPFTVTRRKIASPSSGAGDDAVVRVGDPATIYPSTSDE
jgi:hypothetical protein